MSDYGFRWLLEARQGNTKPLSRVGRDRAARMKSDTKRQRVELARFAIDHANTHEGWLRYHLDKYGPEDFDAIMAGEDRDRYLRIAEILLEGTDYEIEDEPEFAL